MKKFNLKGIMVLITFIILGALLSNFSVVIGYLVMVGQIYGYHLLHTEFGGGFTKARNFGSLALAFSILINAVPIVNTVAASVITGNQFNLATIMFVVVVLFVSGVLTLIQDIAFLTGLIDVAKLGKQDELAKKLTSNLSMVKFTQLGIVIITPLTVALAIVPGMIILIGFLGMVVSGLAIVLVIVNISYLINAYKLYKELHDKDMEFNSVDDAKRYYDNNPNLLSESLEKTAYDMEK